MGGSVESGRDQIRLMLGFDVGRVLITYARCVLITGIEETGPAGAGELALLCTISRAAKQTQAKLSIITIVVVVTFMITIRRKMEARVLFISLVVIIKIAPLASYLIRWWRGSRRARRWLGSD